MADFVPNISKGHVAEWFRNVDQASPANSCLVLALLAATGYEGDSVMMDKVTFADMVSGATNEATNTGYYRKKLVSTDIAMPSPDNVNDRLDLDIPVDPVWGTGTTGPANDGTGGLSGTTAANNMIPMGVYDYAITPGGAPITVQINPAGFIRVIGG
jgi:hypothetical protein